MQEQRNTSEAYSELYHYTSATGLKGIVESQQLWATNVAYLNDAEEHTGFFDRRLPQLLEQAAREEMSHMSAGDLARIGEARMLEDVAALGRSIRRATLKWNDPFVVSLCGPPPTDQGDGLLSQWRGYGPDGGYAVVFDAKVMDALFQEEIALFNYQYLVWGDIEYYDGEDGAPRHPETEARETSLKQAVRNRFKTGALDEGVYECITALSVLYKHRGFREEAEVRIVAMPVHPTLVVATAGDEVRPEKPVAITLRDGALVPHLALFGNGQRLPISSVIVGPHRDRERRKLAVEMLLKQHKVDAEVRMADIPYRGR
jgi:hypothetical protein